LTPQPIKLADSPRAYGLPFDDWYPNQQGLAERTVNLAKGTVLVVQSPVGSGKSTLPAVVSYFRPHTFSLMGSRELQVQYADSLPVFTILWGQEWYGCADADWVEFLKSRYGHKATRADCPWSAHHGKQCRAFNECPYELAKRQVLAARAVATNYACAWHVDWWKGTCRDLFADEAHTLADQILSQATVEISDETRKAFRLAQFPRIEQHEQHKKVTYDKVVLWLSKSIGQLERVAAKNAHSKFGTWAQRTKIGLEDLSDSVEGASEGTWFIQVTNGTLKAEPIHPKPFTKCIIPDGARSIVLMSATIGKPEILLGRLGLDNVPSEFVSVPHPFPKENRPVFFVRKSPRLSYRSGDKAYGLQADLIANIMNDHRGEKGIVHTASWNHAMRLMALLAERGQAERLFLPQGKRIEKVEEFRRMPMGTVAISPSWSEGLDLVGEAGTLSITAKIPFKPIGSPVEKLRLQCSGGHDEYRQDAANKVAQQSGRIVRTPTDVGVTYIVDSNWELVKDNAPDWFEVETI
jgi:Rad3-related DNA helicase